MYSIIDCAEEHGSASESADHKTGLKASVTLRCAYADRMDLVQDLIGNRRAWPHGSYSEPPVAISTATKPVPGRYTTIGQVCYYEEALVTVNYSTEDKDLISESLEPTSEFLTLDFKRFRWGSVNGDPILEGEAPGRILRGMNLVRTIHEVDPPIPTSLLSLQGHCNEVAYSSALLGLSFDTETLLFQPPSLSRQIKSSGAKAFSLVLKFAFKEQGWNNFWRAATQEYERMYDVENGEYFNYPRGSFSDFLF